MSEFLNNIKNQFEKFCGENPSNDIVNDFRIKSFENFNNLGLPTTKDEDWRFTNLNEFYKNQYSIPPTKKEFNKISGSIKQGSLTIIPLSLYFSEKGLAKLSCGIAKGKKK